MAGVESNIKLLSGDYDLMVNETGAKALQANLETLGPIKYTQDEIDFANRIMKEYGNGTEAKGLSGEINPLETTKPDPEGGSTDVGDVSYLVPEITLLATTAPYPQSGLGRRESADDNDLRAQSTSGRGSATAAGAKVSA